MNRLTTWRSFGQNKHFENPSHPGTLGAFVKRNIKTSTPVSHSFGRGYGTVQSKPVGLRLLQARDGLITVPRRDMAVGKPKTKAEMAIEEENLKPKNLKLGPAKENLDEISQDLVRLSEKEIQSILEADANSIQTERGKTWLEQSKYALREVPNEKDALMLARQIGNTTVTVKFKKEYEEEPVPEDAAEEGNEEGENQTEEEIAKQEDQEGQEDWIRSGDELPDREDFPQKHNLEIDINIADKEGKPKGKLHLYGFAGVDDRLYINEMLCENDLPGFTEEKEKGDDKRSYCVFDDLSDPMQDRIYDYLDELGVDDRMAHFVKTTVAREKKQNDIAFLTNFKEILKG